MRVAPTKTGAFSPPTDSHPQTSSFFLDVPSSPTVPRSHFHTCSGNVMTGRSSTRLHAPPGGTSQAGSLIFGSGGDAGDRFAGHRGRSSAAQQQQKSSISFGAAAQEPFKAKAVNNQIQQQPQAIKKAGTSANAFASGTNQNCGNFITDRPTSRVLAPPGGKSSGPLW